MRTQHNTLIPLLLAGLCAAALPACDAPDGYAAVGGDCADGDAGRRPDTRGGRTRVTC